MKQKKRDRRRDLTAYNPKHLPEVLPPEDERHLVHVFVEGYEEYSTTSAIPICASRYRCPTAMTYPKARRC